MTSVESHYPTAAAFRRGLDDRLKTTSKGRGRPFNELRREFLFQRFLAMVFAEPAESWVLKGGAGLLMRFATARYSQDIDLLRLDSVDVGHSVDELRRLTQPKPGDYLAFTLGDAVTYSPGNPVVRIKVLAAIGGDYDTFTIDLAHDLHVVARPERVRPVPVVAMPGLPELPELAVYPLVDQVADKLCAMYERHGPTGRTSTRFPMPGSMESPMPICVTPFGMRCALLTSKTERRSSRSVQTALGDSSRSWSWDSTPTTPGSSTPCSCADRSTDSWKGGDDDHDRDRTG